MEAPRKPHGSLVALIFSVNEVDGFWYRPIQNHLLESAIVVVERGAYRSTSGSSVPFAPPLLLYFVSMKTIGNSTILRLKYRVAQIQAASVGYGLTARQRRDLHQAKTALSVALGKAQ